MSKISGLDILAVAPANSDLIVLVDVSDTTQAPTGSLKQQTVANFLSGVGGAVDSVNGATGVVVLDKSDVGLGSVDNTADTAKPVSTAQQTALDAKQASGATLTSLEGLALTAGDILYATAADTLVRLPKGTAAQVLKMNAGATAPEWGTASGGGSTTTPSSYSLTMYQSTNELSKSTAGGYASATFGANGMGTYMTTAGAAGVRQELVRNFYNFAAMARVKSFYVFTYISGDINTALSHKIYVGIGPVGNGSSGQDINENANNIGFTIESILDGYIKIYAVNGNGTTSTKTEIYSRDVVTLDGGSPSISPILTFNNTGSAITFYIDGTLGATHTTNIPTADVSRTFTWLGQKTAGVAAKWMSVDIIETSYTLV